jgi:transposase
MAKQSIVNRVDDERAQLLALTKRGTVSARRLSRAHMLRHADTGLSDDAMAQALHSGTATVERIRKRGGEDGLAAALRERPRPGGQRTLDGTQAAVLLALAWSAPPEGRAGWTRQWLADRLVALQVVEAIADETVRRTRNKTASSRGSRRPGVFPVGARSVSGAWQLSWISPGNSMLPSILWSVSMSVPTHGCVRAASPGQPLRGRQSGTTTHRAGKVPATCGWPSRRCRAGGRSRSRPGARPRTLRTVCKTWWTSLAPQRRWSGWCGSICTRTPPPRGLPPVRPRKRAVCCGSSMFMTPPCTAVG